MVQYCSGIAHTWYHLIMGLFHTRRMDKYACIPPCFTQILHLHQQLRDHQSINQIRSDQIRSNQIHSSTMLKTFPPLLLTHHEFIQTGLSTDRRSSWMTMRCMEFGSSWTTKKMGSWSGNSGRGPGRCKQPGVWTLNQRQEGILGYHGDRIGIKLNILG